MAAVFASEETARAATGVFGPGAGPGAEIRPALVRGIDAATQDPALLASDVSAVTPERFIPGSNGKLIVLMRDAHANLSAQKNLHKAIDFWSRESGIDLVLSEAAWGEASLSDAQSGLSAKDLKLAADRLLWENLITGHEYQTLVSKRPVRIVGVEDPELYRRSREVFRRMVLGREKALRSLVRARALVDEMKRRDYPKELLEFEESFASAGPAASADMDWSKRYREIRRLASASAAPLSSDAQKAVEPFLQLEAMEKSIDPARLALEQEQALAQARANCGACADSLLRSFEKAGTSIAALESAVGQLALASGRERWDAGSEMGRYAAYLRSAGSLRVEPLISALEFLEEELYAFAAGSRSARVTRFVDRHTRLLENAYRLRLTPDDTERLEAELRSVHPVSWQAEVNDRLLERGNTDDLLEYLPELTSRLTAVRNFYRLAALRDQVFVRRSGEALAASGETAAVLVTGGYHTSRLADLFAERGYSVAVFTPYVAHETDQAAYERSVLSGDPARSSLLAPLVRTPEGSARLDSAVKTGAALSPAARTLAARLAALSAAESPARTAPAVPAVSGARMTIEGDDDLDWDAPEPPAARLIKDFALSEGEAAQLIEWAGGDGRGIADLAGYEREPLHKVNVHSREAFRRTYRVNLSFTARDGAQAVTRSTIYLKRFEDAYGSPVSEDHPYIFDLADELDKEQRLTALAHAKGLAPRTVRIGRALVSEESQDAGFDAWLEESAAEGARRADEVLAGIARALAELHSIRERTGSDRGLAHGDLAYYWPSDPDIDDAAPTYAFQMEHIRIPQDDRPVSFIDLSQASFSSPEDLRAEAEFVARNLAHTLGDVMAEERFLWTYQEHLDPAGSAVASEAGSEAGARMAGADDLEKALIARYAHYGMTAQRGAPIRGFHENRVALGSRDAAGSVGDIPVIWLTFDNTASHDPRSDAHRTPIYGRIGEWRFASLDLKAGIEDLVRDPETLKKIIYIPDLKSSLTNVTDNLAIFAAAAAMGVASVDLEDRVFLDQGSADGILSVLALRKGARRAILIDMDPEMRMKALKLAQANGISADRIVFLERDLNDSAELVEELSRLIRPEERARMVVASNIGDHQIYPLGTYLNAIEAARALGAQTLISGGHFMQLDRSAAVLADAVWSDNPDLSRNSSWGDARALIEGRMDPYDFRILGGKVLAAAAAPPAYRLTRTVQWTDENLPDVSGIIPVGVFERSDAPPSAARMADSEKRAAARDYVRRHRDEFLTPIHFFESTDAFYIFHGGLHAVSTPEDEHAGLVDAYAIENVDDFFFGSPEWERPADFLERDAQYRGIARASAAAGIPIYLVDTPVIEPARPSREDIEERSKGIVRARAAGRVTLLALLLAGLARWDPLLGVMAAVLSFHFYAFRLTPKALLYHRWFGIWPLEALGLIDGAAVGLQRSALAAHKIESIVLPHLDQRREGGKPLIWIDWGAAHADMVPMIRYPWFRKAVLWMEKALHPFRREIKPDLRYADQAVWMRYGDGSAGAPALIGRVIGPDGAAVGPTSPTGARMADDRPADVSITVNQRSAIGPSRRTFLGQLGAMLLGGSVLSGSGSAQDRPAAPLEGRTPDPQALDQMLRFLELNTFEGGIPMSFRAPEGYWRSIGSDPDQPEAMVERLMIGESGKERSGSVNVYDGSLWQIWMARNGRADAADRWTEVLRSGSLGEMTDIRAYREPFAYGPAQVKPEKDQAFVFRSISPYGLQTDPLDGKTESESFPDGGKLKHVDWKPVAGENAWALFIGPLQSAAAKYRNGWPAADPEELKIGIRALRTVEAMQSPNGAIYHVPAHTAGKSASDIFIENNASMYAALRMLERTIAARPRNAGNLSGPLAAVRRVLSRMDRFWKDHSFDRDRNVFHTGLTEKDGRPVPTGEFAVDAQTWTVAVLGPEWIVREIGGGDEGIVHRILTETKRRAGSFKNGDPNGELIGLGFTDGHDVISGEWTAGGILAWRVAADHYQKLYARTRDERHKAWAIELWNDARTMRDGLEALKVPQADGSLAYQYADRRVWIPFGWWGNPIPSLASTAWVAMIDSGFNPFVLGGGSIPSADHELLGLPKPSGARMSISRRALLAGAATGVVGMAIPVSSWAARTGMDTERGEGRAAADDPLEAQLASVKDLAAYARELPGWIDASRKRRTLAADLPRIRARWDALLTAERDAARTDYETKEKAARDRRVRTLRSKIEQAQSPDDRDALYAELADALEPKYGAQTEGNVHWARYFRVSHIANIDTRLRNLEHPEFMTRVRAQLEEERIRRGLTRADLEVPRLLRQVEFEVSEGMTDDEVRRTRKAEADALLRRTTDWERLEDLSYGWRIGVERKALERAAADGDLGALIKARLSALAVSGTGKVAGLARRIRSEQERLAEVSSVVDRQIRGARYFLAQAAQAGMTSANSDTTKVAPDQVGKGIVLPGVPSAGVSSDLIRLAPVRPVDNGDPREYYEASRAKRSPFFKIEETYFDQTKTSGPYVHLLDEKDLPADAAAWLADAEHGYWYFDPNTGRTYGRFMDLVVLDDQQRFVAGVYFTGTDMGGNYPRDIYPRNLQTQNPDLYQILTRPRGSPDERMLAFRYLLPASEIERLKKRREQRVKDRDLHPESEWFFVDTAREPETGHHYVYFWEGEDLLRHAGGEKVLVVPDDNGLMKSLEARKGPDGKFAEDSRGRREQKIYGYRPTDYQVVTGTSDPASSGDPELLLEALQRELMLIEGGAMAYDPEYEDRWTEYNQRLVGKEFKSKVVLDEVRYLPQTHIHTGLASYLKWEDALRKMVYSDARAFRRSSAEEKKRSDFLARMKLFEKMIYRNDRGHFHMLVPSPRLVERQAAADELEFLGLRSDSVALRRQIEGLMGATGSSGARMADAGVSGIFESLGRERFLADEYRAQVLEKIFKQSRARELWARFIERREREMRIRGSIARIAKTRNESPQVTDEAVPAPDPELRELLRQLHEWQELDGERIAEWSGIFEAFLKWKGSDRLDSEAEALENRLFDLAKPGAFRPSWSGGREALWVAEARTREIFLALSALHLAWSRMYLERWDEEERGGTVRTVHVTLSMYQEQNRMLSRHEHPNGEDFLREKVRQLNRLFNGVKNIRWRLTLVDDETGKSGDELSASAVLAHRIIAELEANGDVRPGQVDLIFTRDAVSDLNMTSVLESRKGAGIQYGMARAAAEGSDYIIFTDADLSTRLDSEAIRLIAPMRDGGIDLAYGSRSEPRSLVLVKPLLNEIRSKAYNLLIRSRLGIGDIRDTQAGFKGFKRSAAQRILPLTRDRGLSFDSELFKIAQATSMSITAVPIPWIDSVEESTIQSSDIVRNALGVRGQVVRWVHDGDEAQSRVLRGMRSTYLNGVFFIAAEVIVPVQRLIERMARNGLRETIKNFFYRIIKLDPVSLSLVRITHAAASWILPVHKALTVPWHFLWDWLGLELMPRLINWARALAAFAQRSAAAVLTPTVRNILLGTAAFVAEPLLGAARRSAARIRQILPVMTASLSGRVIQWIKSPGFDAVALRLLRWQSGLKEIVGHTRVLVRIAREGGADPVSFRSLMDRLAIVDGPSDAKQRRSEAMRDWLELHWRGDHARSVLLAQLTNWKTLREHGITSEEAVRTGLASWIESAPSSGPDGDPILIKDVIRRSGVGTDIIYFEDAETLRALLIGNAPVGARMVDVPELSDPILRKANEYWVRLDTGDSAGVLQELERFASDKRSAEKVWKQRRASLVRDLIRLVRGRFGEEEQSKLDGALARLDPKELTVLIEAVSEHDFWIQTKHKEVLRKRLLRHLHSALLEARPQPGAVSMPIRAGSEAILDRIRSADLPGLQQTFDAAAEDHQTAHVAAHVLPGLRYVRSLTDRSTASGRAVDVRVVIPISGSAKDRERIEGDAVRSKIRELEGLFGVDSSVKWKIYFVDNSAGGAASERVRQKISGDPDLARYLEDGSVQVIQIPDDMGRAEAIKGGQIIHGFHQVIGDLEREGAMDDSSFVFFADLNLNIHMANLGLLIRSMLDADAPADIAIGSRNLKESFTDVKPPYGFLHSAVFNLFVRLTHPGLDPILDTQAGLKGYNAGMLRRILPRMRDASMAVDTETLVLARLVPSPDGRPVRIEEVPVSFIDRAGPKGYVKFEKTINSILGRVFDQRKRLGLRGWADPVAHVKPLGGGTEFEVYSHPLLRTVYKIPKREAPLPVRMGVAFLRAASGGTAADRQELAVNHPAAQFLLNNQGWLGRAARSLFAKHNSRLKTWIRYWEDRKKEDWGGYEYAIRSLKGLIPETRILEDQTLRIKKRLGYRTVSVSRLVETEKIDRSLGRELRSAVESGDMRLASEWIEKFFKLQEAMWRRGAFDPDPNLLDDVGITREGELVLLDPGDIIFDREEALLHLTGRRLEEKINRYDQKIFESFAPPQLVGEFRRKYREQFRPERLIEVWRTEAGTGSGRPGQDLTPHVMEKGTLEAAVRSRYERIVQMLADGSEGRFLPMIGAGSVEPRLLSWLLDFGHPGEKRLVREFVMGIGTAWALGDPDAERLIRRYLTIEGRLPSVFGPILGASGAGEGLQNIFQTVADAGFGRDEGITAAAADPSAHTAGTNVLLLNQTPGLTLDPGRSGRTNIVVQRSVDRDAYGDFVGVLGVARDFPDRVREGAGREVWVMGNGNGTRQGLLTVNSQFNKGMIPIFGKPLSVLAADQARFTFAGLIGNDHTVVTTADSILLPTDLDLNGIEEQIRSGEPADLYTFFNPHILPTDPDDRLGQWSRIHQRRAFEALTGPSASDPKFSGLVFKNFVDSYRADRIRKWGGTDVPYAFAMSSKLRRYFAEYAPRYLEIGKRNIGNGFQLRFYSHFVAPLHYPDRAGWNAIRDPKIGEEDWEELWTIAQEIRSNIRYRSLDYKGEFIDLNDPRGIYNLYEITANHPDPRKRHRYARYFGLQGDALQQGVLIHESSIRLPQGVSLKSDGWAVIDRSILDLQAPEGTVISLPSGTVISESRIEGKLDGDAGGNWLFRVSSDEGVHLTDLGKLQSSVALEGIGEPVLTGHPIDRPMGQVDKKNRIPQDEKPLPGLEGISLADMFYKRFGLVNAHLPAVERSDRSRQQYREPSSSDVPGSDFAAARMADAALPDALELDLQYYATWRDVLAEHPEMDYADHGMARQEEHEGLADGSSLWQAGYYVVDGKPYLAFEPGAFPRVARRLWSYESARRSGFTNLAEVRLGADHTVLTRLAQSYSDEELLAADTDLEALFVYMLLYGDWDHAPPAEDGLVNNVYRRTIALPQGGVRTVYLVIDNEHAFEEGPYRHPIGTDDHAWTIAKNFFGHQLDRGRIHGLIDRLNLSRTDRREFKRHAETALKRVDSYYLRGGARMASVPDWLQQSLIDRTSGITKARRHPAIQKELERIARERDDDGPIDVAVFGPGLSRIREGRLASYQLMEVLGVDPRIRVTVVDGSTVAGELLSSELQYHAIPISSWLDQEIEGDDVNYRTLDADQVRARIRQVVREDFSNLDRIRERLGLAGSGVPDRFDAVIATNSLTYVTGGTPSNNPAILDLLSSAVKPDGSVILDLYTLNELLTDPIRPRDVPDGPIVFGGQEWNREYHDDRSTVVIRRALFDPHSPDDVLENGARMSASAGARPDPYAIGDHRIGDPDLVGRLVGEAKANGALFATGLSGIGKSHTWRREAARENSRILHISAAGQVHESGIIRQAVWALRRESPDADPAVNADPTMSADEMVRRIGQRTLLIDGLALLAPAAEGVRLKDLIDRGVPVIRVVRSRYRHVQEAYRNFEALSGRSPGIVILAPMSEEAYRTSLVSGAAREIVSALRAPGDGFLPRTVEVPDEWKPALELVTAKAPIFYRVTGGNANFTGRVLDILFERDRSKAAPPVTEQLTRVFRRIGSVRSEDDLAEWIRSKASHWNLLEHLLTAFEASRADDLRVRIFLRFREPIPVARIQAWPSDERDRVAEMSRLGILVRDGDSLRVNGWTGAWHELGRSAERRSGARMADDPAEEKLRQGSGGLFGWTFAATAALHGVTSWWTRASLPTPDDIGRNGLFFDITHHHERLGDWWTALHATAGEVAGFYSRLLSMDYQIVRGDHAPPGIEWGWYWLLFVPAAAAYMLVFKRFGPLSRFGSALALGGWFANHLEGFLRGGVVTNMIQIRSSESVSITNTADIAIAVGVVLVAAAVAVRTARQLAAPRVSAARMAGRLEWGNLYRAPAAHWPWASLYHWLVRDSVEVVGIENIPPGKAILAGNHVSSVGTDGVIVATEAGLRIGRVPQFVVQSEALGLLTWFLAWAGGFIPVKPHETARTMVRRLDTDGAPIIGIFPAGRPSKSVDRNVKLFDASAVARVAFQTGTPVVPFYTESTLPYQRSAWGLLPGFLMEKLHLRRKGSGGKVRIVLGNAIRPSDHGSPEGLMTELKSSVLTLAGAPSASPPDARSADRGTADLSAARMAAVHTGMTTFDGRLATSEEVAASLLRKGDRVLEVGVGMFPYTVANLADRVPDVSIDAVDHALPSVVLVSGDKLTRILVDRYRILKNFRTAARNGETVKVVFDQAGEPVTIEADSAQLYDLGAAVLYRDDPKKMAQYEALKQELKARLAVRQHLKKYEAPRSDDPAHANIKVDPDGNLWHEAPHESGFFARPNVRYYPADVVQQDAAAWTRGAEALGSYRLIRDFNLSAAYFTAEKKSAVYARYASLLQEGGYLMVGRSANDHYVRGAHTGERTSEFVLYRKVRGTLTPISFTFTVAPNPAEALDSPGAFDHKMTGRSEVMNSLFEADLRSGARPAGLLGSYQRAFSVMGASAPAGKRPLTYVADLMIRGEFYPRLASILKRDGYRTRVEREYTTRRFLGKEWPWPWDGRPIAMTVFFDGKKFPRSLAERMMGSDAPGAVRSDQDRAPQASGIPADARMAADPVPALQAAPAVRRPRGVRQYLAEALTWAGVIDLERSMKIMGNDRRTSQDRGSVAPVRVRWFEAARSDQGALSAPPRADQDPEAWAAARALSMEGREITEADRLAPLEAMERVIGPEALRMLADGEGTVRILSRGNEREGIYDFEAGNGKARLVFVFLHDPALDRVRLKHGGFKVPAVTLTPAQRRAKERIEIGMLRRLSDEVRAGRLVPPGAREIVVDEVYEDKRGFFRRAGYTVERFGSDDEPGSVFGDETPDVPRIRTYTASSDLTRPQGSWIERIKKSDRAGARMASVRIAVVHPGRMNEVKRGRWNDYRENIEVLNFGEHHLDQALRSLRDGQTGILVLHLKSDRLEHDRPSAGQIPDRIIRMIERPEGTASAPVIINASDSVTDEVRTRLERWKTEGKIAGYTVNMESDHLGLEWLSNAYPDRVWVRKRTPTSGGWNVRARMAGSQAVITFGRTPSTGRSFADRHPFELRVSFGADPAAPDSTTVFKIASEKDVELDGSESGHSIRIHRLYEDAPVAETAKALELFGFELQGPSVGARLAVSKAQDTLDPARSAPDRSPRPAPFKKTYRTSTTALLHQPARPEDLASARPDTEADRVLSRPGARLPDAFALNLVTPAARTGTGMVAPRRMAAVATKVPGSAHLTFVAVMPSGSSAQDPAGDTGPGSSDDERMADEIRWQARLAGAMFMQGIEMRGQEAYAIHEISGYEAAEPSPDEEGTDPWIAAAQDLADGIQKNPEWHVRFTYKGRTITDRDIVDELDGTEAERLRKVIDILQPYHTEHFPYAARVIGDLTLSEARAEAASMDPDRISEWTGAMVFGDDRRRTAILALFLQMALSSKDDVVRFEEDPLVEMLRVVTQRPEFTARDAENLRTGDLRAIERSGNGLERVVVRVGARLSQAVQRAFKSLTAVRTSA